MIDASIPLQVQPAKYDDPSNQLMRILQIQGLQDARTKEQRALDQETALNESYRGALGADGTVDQNALLRALANRGQGSKIPAVQKTLLENDNTRAQTEERRSTAGKNNSESENLIIGQYRNMVDSVRDPQSAIEFVTHMHSDPRLKDSAIARVPLEQALAQIPQDPSGIPAWKQQFAVGAAKYVELNKPTTNVVNTGGKTQMVQTPGLGGAPTVAQSFQNTQSPDNAATVGATIRGQNLTDSRARDTLAQSDRHFQAGQNAPQYMETDAGLVALPKKLGAGEAPVGTPVMGANGQPLGKPLKDIPPAVNGAIIQNSQSLNQIDRALTLLDGKNVGAQQGDKAATGYKGYLPNGMLNRMDPKGVDTRAEISDIGSLKIHDRSGAAVTVSESPRLMPFVPLATDDAATVKKKLSRLRTELANESQALQETYSKDQGYKPSPVKPGGARQPTVTNW